MGRTRQHNTEKAGAALALAFCALAVSFLTAVQPALAAEPPAKLWRTCEKGSGAGQCEFPRGIASDPETGHLYVADDSNSRINELTAWGEFVKAWGWGVRDGSPEPQTCTTETSCFEGLAGGGAGQLSQPLGVATDSEGDVYVVDKNNKRVQKFDRQGNFLLMFGGDVNKTKVEEGGTEAQRNLCTAVSGNVCQTGTTGTGNGQFGSWTFGGFITVGPDDTVYVGDQNRIQKFSAEGAYQGEIAFPGETVAALAADPQTGQLYVNLQDQLNVRKIGTGGEAVCSTEDVAGDEVRSIAADSAGHLYAVIDLSGGSNRVQAFKPDCTADSEVTPFGEEELSNSSFVATGSACLTSGADVYLTNGDPLRPDGHFVSAYGSPPDKVGLCPPPPNPPGIEEEFAASVETTEALLKVQINPHFWADTSYYLEYGPQPCSEGGCTQKPLPPGSSLGAGAIGAGVTVGVHLDGLFPATTYYYRFVATSHCVASEPAQECTTIGVDRTFLTFSSSGPAACPNEASRIGFGSLLPDCRAYEMVSPIDKDGGDIRVLEAEQGAFSSLEQSAESGERLAYNSARAFGDSVSAPYTSQYIAQRIAGQEWQTHSINSPRGTSVFDVLHQLTPEFRAFSADLCDGWQVTYGEGALAEGAQAGYENLYRRSDRLCGKEGYQTLAPLALPQFLPGEIHEFVFERIFGVSADGAVAIFLANGKLVPNAASGAFQLYESADGGPPLLVCILPDAAPQSKSCVAGSGESTGADPGGALSSDGERVFWSATSGGAGKLYLRQNPAAPESARLHGAASGKGTLIGPATGTGNVSGEFAKGVKVGSGGFAVGQEISDSAGKIPANTTIVNVEETAPGTFTLTLSAKASGVKPGDFLTGAASEEVPALLTETGAFEAGQEISAPGIPPATTVLACSPSCGPGATSLTLSAKATKTEIGAALAATSPCTEAQTKACTIVISKAAEEATGKTDASFFWGSADDGSKAIFTTGNLGESANLYSFEPDGEATSLLAEDVIGVMGISADAARVYFASSKVLSGEETNSNGDKAQLGKPNLYLYEAGASTSFIATLAGADLTEDTSAERYGKRSARITPDGLHAAFVSAAPLSEYDNKGTGSGNPTAEVYRYDAGTGQLSCASCNPSGARPVGLASIPLLQTPMHGARVLSEDGSRLYFQSADALLPRDANGKVDVYQWEAPGAGTCTEALPTYSAQDEGCIDLVSSGQSHIDSRFVEADPSGKNVFIATASGLLPQDPGGVDIYDARVEGGLPIPQGPPPGCEGEACQSPPEAPNDPTPASSSFHGAGNVVEEPQAGRCAKSKVRRKGRCVAKHHKRAKHQPSGKANSNRRAAR